MQVICYQLVAEGVAEGAWLGAWHLFGVYGLFGWGISVVGRIAYEFVVLQKGARHLARHQLLCD